MVVNPCRAAVLKWGSGRAAARAGDFGCWLRCEPLYSYDARVSQLPDPGFCVVAIPCLGKRLSEIKWRGAPVT